MGTSGTSFPEVLHKGRLGKGGCRGIGRKERLEIKGRRIRALYGHSRVRRIEYELVIPPEHLYHGTHARAAKLIRREGLRPMGRQYVHLSTTRQRALAVGRRRTGFPVLLRVRALQAYGAGVLFYRPEREHYLASVIPASFIDLVSS